MPTQAEKAAVFQELHRKGIFVIPNPWDLGSARLLAHLGFAALATTSAGHAFTLGRRDNTVGRDETLAHARALTAATELPVSADLEHGFGDDPETVAETVRLAAATGIVGGSIEDSTGDPARPVYDLAHAAARVRAAVAAARALPFPFTLTARAENFIVDRRDLADTIARLQAYQDAGADVLYAPGLRTRTEIEAVVRAVDRPVNVLMGLPGVALTLADLEAIGVRRVSVGSTLARACLGTLLRAAREIRERGTFTYGQQAATADDTDEAFEG